jgi:Uncharacterized conserved protein (DUF2039)
MGARLSRRGPIGAALSLRTNESGLSSSCCCFGLEVCPGPQVFGVSDVIGSRDKEEAMSSQKGNASRTRSQKYKNNSVFKNDKYDKTAKTTMLNSMTVANVCERCRSVIEWKIKYKKYKTLTAPRKCVRCEQKSVKHAYHVMCYPCARDRRVCPKCGVKADIQPVEEDQTKLDLEMQQLLKDLPERKRRTFLRFLAAKKDNAGDYLIYLPIK